MKLALTVVVGLLATLGTELAVAALLQLGPRSWPMVDAYWTVTALPAISLNVVVATVLLWGIFRTGWPRYPIGFTLAFLCGLGVELFVLGNPLMDIARYLLIASMVCIIVLGSCYRLRWRPRRLG